MEVRNMYEEYVKQSREELRKKFGEVRIKTDCQNYIAETGKDGCVVCNYDHHRGCLHCALDVCYFYKQKEESK